MERDYKEEYVTHINNQNYRKYETKDLIRVSKVGKTKLNISINPFLKDEFKKINEGKNLSDLIESFIIKEIEKFYNKKVVIKK